MAVLCDCGVFLGGHELTGVKNRVHVDHRPVFADRTGFGTAATRNQVPRGLISEVGGEIFWGDPRPGYRTVRDVLTLIPDNLDSPGSSAFVMPRIEGMVWPDKDAQIPTHSIELTSRNAPFVRGVLLYRQECNSSGHSRAVELPIIQQSEFVLSACHVLHLSADTVSVTVERQDVTRSYVPCMTLTFFKQNGVSAQWKHLAGPIDSSLWRASWTADGSFEACHSIGIY